ncbi:NADH oxidoreductase [Hyaloraphidium curvatum]|nr:NADH oxidoreductase [Hyaloraphidium curvatum]
MAAAVPAKALALQTVVKAEGNVELSLAEVDIPTPGDNEVVVKVHSAPINPSDIYGMFMGADITKATASGTADRPVIAAPIPPAFMAALASSAGKPNYPGNEGGGVVVAAGSSDAAKALLGKTVGVWGGGMYSQYRVLRASGDLLPQCLPMKEGITPTQAAACFVNPLTALGMVETMKLENHKGLVHTAAASNLGQMLVKICLADNVPLVNIVRKPDQAELLRGLGAKYVCDSSQSTFEEDLVKALYETGATLAFDAIGGGTIASTILSCMEKAAVKKEAESGGAFNRYGSSTFKQLYIYGGLDRAPTTLVRSFGFSWSMGGWLLMPFCSKAGPEIVKRMVQRVIDEIDTTFSSSYTSSVSLAKALSLEAISVYAKTATGQKVLVLPHEQ